jgi:hypothetical protein
LAGLTASLNPGDIVVIGLFTNDIGGGNIPTATVIANLLPIIAYLKAKSLKVCLCTAPYGPLHNDTYADFSGDIMNNYTAYGANYVLDVFSCANPVFLPNSLLVTPSVTITGATANGTTITYTCSAALPSYWVVGDSVTISGISSAGGTLNFNRTYITAVYGNTFSVASTSTATYTSGGSAQCNSADYNPGDGIHLVDQAHKKWGLMFANLLASLGYGTMPQLYLTIAAPGTDALWVREKVNRIGNLLAPFYGVNNGGKPRRMARFRTNHIDSVSQMFDLPPNFLLLYNQNYKLREALNGVLPNILQYVTTTNNRQIYY